MRSCYYVTEDRLERTSYHVYVYTLYMTDWERNAPYRNDDPGENKRMSVYAGTKLKFNFTIIVRFYYDYKTIIYGATMEQHY